jgi:vanillate O-demethylase ferredoxin subunit
VTSSRPPWEHAAGSPAAAGPVRIDAVVARRWTAAEDIVGLELHAVDGSSLSGYEPGAHIPVEVAPGVIRHYSLCDGSGGALRIAVLLDPNSRGGSVAVHRSLWPGTVVRIGPPRNDFPLVADVEHTILVAGGIGITPLIAMARALHEQQASFELHYCVRTLSRAAFLTELRTEGYRESVYVHLDDGPPDQRFDPQRVLARPRPGVQLYFCGPTGLLDALCATAAGLGWPKDQISLERFRGAPPVSGHEFSVQAQLSGQTVSVTENQTIVAALAQAGIDVPVSCEEGVCGTCLLKVIDGIPDHRDCFQSDEEHRQNRWITPCCSRSKSPRLVLEV